jgi:hypothetical protein
VVPVRDDVGATPFGFDCGVAHIAEVGVDLHGKADRSGPRLLVVGYETLALRPV